LLTACGGGQENPTARGQKISSPEIPPFFACLQKFYFSKFFLLFLVVMVFFCFLC